MLLTWSIAYGQNAPVSAAPKGYTMDTNTLLIIFAVFLLLPIWILSNTFIATAKRFYEFKIKSGSARVLIPFGILLMSSSLMAQTAKTASTPGLSSNAMNILLLGVIGVELILILFFAHRTNDFIQKMYGKEGSPVRDRDPLTWFKEKWASMNFKPMEEEHALDTGHSYDGIRELDNIVPPWFTTAFLLTILFAAGYLYRRRGKF